MATDYSKDLFATEGDSALITLGFAEDLHLYTPVVSEQAVVDLAEEFGVSPERILTALKRWWFETVRDQLNAFDQHVGELSYDPDVATHFAQRFL
jgi:hypothetical protein